MYKDVESYVHYEAALKENTDEEEGQGTVGSSTRFFLLSRDVNPSYLCRHS
nr:MAG: wsv079-like protein [Chiromantes dehaani nimavirus]